MRVWGPSGDELAEIAAGSAVGRVATRMAAVEQDALLDLVFQSIAGTEKANASLGINLVMLREANEQARSPKRRACLRRTRARRGAHSPLRQTMKPVGSGRDDSALG